MPAFHALSNRVLVRPRERRPEKTPAGLVIPSAFVSVKNEGVVLAVGRGKLAKSGERIPCEVAVGDRVVYPKYDFQKVRVDGEELLMMRDTDVLCVIEA